MKAGRKIGFTLIEILLALLVVSVGIVSIIGLLSNTLNTSRKAHGDINTVGFADMVFNYYHASTNWNEIPPDGNWSVPDYNGGTLDLNSGSFTFRQEGSDGQAREHGTFTFRFSADNPAPDIKTFTLRVWPGFSTNGIPRTFYTELYNWNAKP